jgi:hypothetical protein
MFGTPMLVVINEESDNAGTLFGARVSVDVDASGTVNGADLAQVIKFDGEKLDLTQAKFMVARNAASPIEDEASLTTFMVITQDGSVAGAFLFPGPGGTDLPGTTLAPAHEFSGAKIGFNPEDRFMVLADDYLFVIKEAGDVFAAEIHVGTDADPFDGGSVGDVFPLGGAKIGFNPEDRFMVTAQVAGTQPNVPFSSALVVITDAGDVFGAPIEFDGQGRPQSLSPVFKFSGAKIGFNPEDRFMVAIDNTLVVITAFGDVFGAAVDGRNKNIDLVFRFGGAKIGFGPQDRFMVAIGN